MALFLSALLKAPELARTKLRDRRVAAGATGRAALSRSQILVLGIQFPWQTRTILVPRGAPNLCARCLSAPRCSISMNLASNRNLWRWRSARRNTFCTSFTGVKQGSSGFCYPLPSQRSHVHNANFLAAALLCRVYKHTGQEKFLAPALRAARYSAAKQRPDGSWPYAGRPSSSGWTIFTPDTTWGFAFNGARSGTSEFDGAIRKGFDFYKAHFFRDDGAPRYFHNRTYPSTSIACPEHHYSARVQGFESGRRTGKRAPENVRLAHSVFSWAMNNMWDDRGFFYYRVLRLGKVRTSYMRWSQAWMLLALAELMRASGGPRNQRRSGCPPKRIARETRSRYRVWQRFRPTC